MIEISTYLKSFGVTRSLIQPGEVRIGVNENTYLPENEMERGWLPNIFALFDRLRSQAVDVTEAVVVGVGPGIESLLFIESLSPARLLCIDINPDVLEIAKSNIKENVVTDVQVEVLGGDLLEPLFNLNRKVDFIYENLPNLKVDPSTLLSENAQTASFFIGTASDASRVPQIYQNNRLELHYKFLLQARECLNERGRVMCCIGGRVSVKLILQMFEELGYHEVSIERVGIVQQLNAEEVLGMYADIEESIGQEFSFLPGLDNEVLSLVQDCNKEPSLNRKVDLIEQVRTGELAFNARAAVGKLQLNKPVDHIGLVIQARL